MKPIIAIVGRANVGKSTLFNRLLGKQVAIVEDLPGTTRDRVFADADVGGRVVTLIDTGGLGLLPDSEIGIKVNRQVNVALKEADVVLFMLDVRDGMLAPDYEIADLLRKRQKPVIPIVNKVDNLKLENQVGNFYSLGLGVPIAISAHHNRGIGYIIDALVPLLPPETADVEEKGLPRLAIVGKPNVGKSMLLNAIVGDERVIVHDTPGTTRDAIDTIFYHNGQAILLIDTAGIRKRGKVGVGVDFYSLVRSLRAISRCDIALLVIDATEFITAQDTHIAGYIKQAYKGIILVINKCDLVSSEEREKQDRQVTQRLKFMPHVPVIFTSAKYGDGVKKIIPAALLICQERQKQLSNSVIDKLIKRALEMHAPPPKALRRLDVIRAYQDGINPPSFTLLVNDPELVHFSYERYLENTLRQTFGFYGTSLKLSFKKAPRRRPVKKER